MTGLLHDLMHERADALDGPSIDVDGLVRAADRRVRRRRLALLGGTVAAAAVAALALPLALGGGDDGKDPVVTDPGLAGAFAAHEPSYAVGSVVHIQGLSVDVGRTIRAYVQTDDGVVFSDALGAVWSADGASVIQVGHVDAEVPLLRTDRPRAAWVDPLGHGDGVPLFTVLDQSIDEVVTDPLGNVAGMSVLADGKDPAVVYALDGTNAYVRDHRGAVVWDLTTGESRVLDPAADGSTIDDVSDGVIAYTPSADTSGDGAYRIGSSLQSGIDLTLWNGYFFSPGGRYFLGEPESDDVRVIDTASGRPLPKDDQGYDYFGGYDWVDDTHYAALGVDQPYEDTRVDILSCEAATGVCTTVAKAVGTLSGGLAIPVGEYLGD
jgi:hypothetical protein